MKPDLPPASPPKTAGRRRASEVIGLLLIVAGLSVTLAAAGSLAFDSWQQQQLNHQWEQERQAVHRAIAAAVATPAQAAPSQQAAPAPAPGAVFALRIPKLGYYAAVRQGVTMGVLGLGPGHYPSTAWPGQPGNVGVAAHNVFWIQFDQLKPGDEIVVEALNGTFRYRVTSTRVISPSDSAVLASDQQHRLTLTTCWPLWAGALAPKRFAISALQET